MPPEGFPLAGELPAPDLPASTNNLLDVAGRTRDGGDRWVRGGAIRDWACVEGYVNEPQCPSHELSDPQSCQPSRYFKPVLLEITIAWDPLDYDEAKKQAIDTLERLTSPMLEREMEIGGINTAQDMGNPQLAGAGGVDLVPPTGPNESSAVGMVQDYLYGRTSTVMGPPISSSTAGGAKGTLLMSFETACRVSSALDDDDTHKVFTKFGEWPVIIGNFTPGVVYGVPGLIDVYLDEVEVSETFERTTNEMLLSATRLGLVVFHTCIGDPTQGVGAAVSVTLP